MINSRELLKAGDIVSVEARVVHGNPINGYTWLEIGEGISKAILSVNEKNIYGKVVSKAIEAGDDVKWNTTFCKVKYIEGDYALVRLYQPFDSDGFPSGSYTSCPKYKDCLTATKRGVK